MQSHWKKTIDQLSDVYTAVDNVPESFALDDKSAAINTLLKEPCHA
jgi:hypothetical protein